MINKFKKKKHYRRHCMQVT